MKEEPNFSGRMSRPYDSMDPKVMDDDMLKAAVGEQGPQEEAGQLAKQEGILFKDVLSLQLDFQSKCPGCQECGLGQQGLPDFLCPVSDPQISQSHQCMGYWTPPGTGMGVCMCIKFIQKLHNLSTILLILNKNRKK